MKYREAELREKAAELLNSQQVDVVLGLKENEDVGHPTPLFVRSAEDAAQLVWNENCYVNLAVYLNELKGKKVAIAAKPGDVRSINNLLSEKQIKEDDVIVLEMEWEDKEAEGSVTEWMNDADTKERFARFMKEIDKCTLCFACRQACPNCYCESCYLDRKATPWNLNDVDRATKVTYHLTRAMHLSGRCSDCGGCRDACDFGVDLLYLMQGVREFLDDNYDFRAGESPDQISAMNSYGPEDTEIGFLGGDN